MLANAYLQLAAGPTGNDENFPRSDVVRPDGWTTTLFLRFTADSSSEARSVAQYPERAR